MPAVGRGGPAVPIGGIPPGWRNPEIVGEDKQTFTISRSAILLNTQMSAETLHFYNINGTGNCYVVMTMQLAYQEESAWG